MTGATGFSTSIVCTEFEAHFKKWCFQNKAAVKPDELSNLCGFFLTLVEAQHFQTFYLQESYSSYKIAPVVKVLALIVIQEMEHFLKDLLYLLQRWIKISKTCITIFAEPQSLLGDLNQSTSQNYCEDKRVGNLFVTLNFSDEKQDINISDKEIVT